MPSRLLLPIDIRTLLKELADDLHSQGVRARIFVVGGAAMALAYYDREGTKDVDAVFAPAELVLEAAADVGRRHGLAHDWLNRAAGMYLPADVGMDSGRLTIESGGVEVAVAPPDLLLAMKLRASRGRRDLEDIAVLVRIVGVDSVQAATCLYDEFYPEDPLPARARPALERAFGDIEIHTVEGPLHLSSVPIRPR